MNKIRFTKTGVVLTVWETCERLRNVNNIINVVASSKIKIEAGDILYSNKGAKGLSTWEVVEVKEVKKSSLKNKKVWILKIIYNKILIQNEKEKFLSSI